LGKQKEEENFIHDQSCVSIRSSRKIICYCNEFIDDESNSISSKL